MEHNPTAARHERVMNTMSRPDLHQWIEIVVLELVEDSSVERPGEIRVKCQEHNGCATGRSTLVGEGTLVLEQILERGGFMLSKARIGTVRSSPLFAFDHDLIIRGTEGQPNVKRSLSDVARSRSR